MGADLAKIGAGFSNGLQLSIHVIVTLNKGVLREEVYFFPKLIVASK